MRRTALLPLLILIGLPACATTSTPRADRIVYRSHDASAPQPDAGPQHHPVRRPVREISEEERIQWHRDHAPPPQPPRVVHETRIEYVERPTYYWWPSLSWGFHYGRHHGHGHHGRRWGFGLGYGHYGW